MSRTKYAYLVYASDLDAMIGKVAKAFRTAEEAVEYLEKWYKNGCFDKVKIGVVTFWSGHYYETISEDFLESLK